MRSPRTPFFVALTLPLVSFALVAASCGGGSSPDSTTSTTSSGVGGAGHGGSGGNAAGGGGGDDAGAIQYPANIDPSEAEALRKQVEAFAAATEQQPVSCEFVATTSMGSPVDVKDVPYVIKVAPVELGPPYGDQRRDYSVLFKTSQKIPNPDDAGPIDGSQSLIVSYIPTVAPTLQLKNGVYTYQFHGALTDQLEVSPLASGPSGRRLVFTKLAPDDSVVLSITCPQH